MSRAPIKLNLKDPSNPIRKGCVDECLIKKEDTKALTLEQHMETLNLSHAKYTKAQLYQAFCMVMNPKGWRLPISKLIEHPGADNVDCAIAAIALVTGSVPEVVSCHMCQKICIKADGYLKADGCFEVCKPKKKRTQ